MSKYSQDRKVVEFVAVAGQRESKSTSNKLSAQSTAKKWGGATFKDTYVETATGDRVFHSRKKV